MLAAYTVGDAIWTLLVLLGWIVLIALGIWLLIGAIQDRYVQWWVKVLLVVLLIVFPPAGFIGCLAFWLDRRSRYPKLWEGPTPLGPVSGPAEVHRLDESVVIVEAGQRYDP